MTDDHRLLTADCRLPTILVTGGCGFIGTNLVKYLTERGHKVRILDNLSTSSTMWTADRRPSTADCRLPTADLVVGDIRDREMAEKAVAGTDAVVHLAAHTSVVESLDKPEEDWDINVNGTLSLLEACRHNGVNRFIFASSNAVLGEQPSPVDETKVPKPLSPYGASKLAGEGLCSAYCHSFGLRTVSLRFGNVYGPFSEHKTSVITKFLDLARQGKPLIIYGDGNQTRDFIHADDICQAVHLSLTAADHGLSTADYGLPTADSISGEVFQIASGVETSINELAEMIRQMTADPRLSTADCRVPTKYEPKRKGEIERNYADISKARRLLGFEPGVKVNHGLRDLWERHTAQD